jgi:hypothetical protein
MDLELESGRVIRGATEEDILSYVEGEEFAILVTEPNSYIQCTEQKKPPYEYVLDVSRRLSGGALPGGG